jgi:uncharacterized protein (DUF2235 family)
MKRLVLCGDGTWNVRDQLDEHGKRRPTNVTKVARAIRPRDMNGVDQIVFYHDGVGTGGATDTVTGGAFGHGIEENVRNLYRFIVYNYAPGDELFFFGFSRGAFTMRTLAGFMKLVGLTEKDDDFFVPDMYACYEGNTGPGTPEWKRAFQRVKGQQPCPNITFIGVWDTVGALGAPGVIGKAASALNGNKYGYHDVQLNGFIQNAYHALAIDERRRPFMPNLWVRPADWHGNLEQAWFPGVHSDVGGGYERGGLANEALHWMVSKAHALGLEFDDAYLAFYAPHWDGDLHNSMSVKYRLMGGAYDRPIGNQPADGETVHRAAIERWRHQSDYRPVNLQRYFEKHGMPTPT